MPPDGRDGTNVAARPADITELAPSPDSPSVSRWKRWAPALAYGLTLWLATRLAFLGIAIGVSLTLPHHGLLPIRNEWPVRIFASWDGAHFQRISQYGYFGAFPGHPGPRTCCDQAFFPGYPLVGRYVSQVFGFGHPTIVTYLWSLAVVAWIGAAVAAVALWRLVADRLGDTAANRSVILLLVGPYAVFLMASYSECMFLAFAIPAWLAATRRRWWWAGILAAGAAFTRIDGVFLALALIVMYFQQARKDHSRWLQPRLAALTFPFLATFSYIAWLRAMTGSWTNWKWAQEKGWLRTFAWPWSALHKSIERVSIPNLEFENAAEIAFAGMIVIAIGALIVLRRWPDLVYVGLGGLALLTSTFYVSVPRSTLILFPMTILVAEWSVQRRWEWIFPLVLTGSITILAINTVYFVQGRWAG
jgi:hypothetical protein